MEPATIKRILEGVILKVMSDSSTCVCNPEKDFSGNRKLPLQTMIKMRIGMGGSSLCKERTDWFRYSEETVSVPAYVQQRKKIKYEALNDIFQTMIWEWDKHLFDKGHRLFAVDGSD